VSPRIDTGRTKKAGGISRTSSSTIDWSGLSRVLLELQPWASPRLPLRHLWNPGAFSIEGRPAPPPGQSVGAASLGSGLPKHGSIALQQVTPGYFAALGIPLVRGRLLDGRDGPDAPMAALINETAAHKFFLNEDPMGKRLTVDMTSYFPKMTIG
jgi:hypothetical protein